METEKEDIINKCFCDLCKIEKLIDCVINSMQSDANIKDCNYEDALSGIIDLIKTYKSIMYNR